MGPIADAIEALSAAGGGDDVAGDDRTWNQEHADPKDEHFRCEASTGCQDMPSIAVMHETGCCCCCCQVRPLCRRHP